MYQSRYSTFESIKILEIYYLYQKVKSIISQKKLNMSSQILQKYPKIQFHFSKHTFNPYNKVKNLFEKNSFKIILRKVT